jgi:hypothetical protein
MISLEWILAAWCVAVECILKVSHHRHIAIVRIQENICYRSLPVPHSISEKYRQCFITYRRRASAMLLFNIIQKIILNKSCIFLQVCYCTSFRNPTLSPGTQDSSVDVATGYGLEAQG